MLFCRLGVPLPDAAGVQRIPAPGVVLMVVVPPLFALPLGAATLSYLEEAISDLFDKRWRLATKLGGADVDAVTRFGRLVSVSGDVVHVDGKSVSGTELTSAEVIAVGQQEVALALGEDDADTLLLAAFAGMLARGEIVVQRGSSRSWRRSFGDPANGRTSEAPDWFICLGPADPPLGSVEAAIVDAVQRRQPPPMAPRRPAESTSRGGYRAAAGIELDERGWVSAAEAHNAGRNAAIAPPLEPAGVKPRASTVGTITARLRKWMKLEPAFSVWVVERSRELYL
jgi:hypothetical protein